MTFYKLTLLSSSNPFTKYEEIAKSKHKYKTILYGTESSKSLTYSRTYNIVKQCYKSYATIKEHLEDMVAYPNFEPYEKEALLHCYNGNTKLVKELKEDIIKKQNIYYRSKCAYCGIGDTNYMDHYLPKDDFPEYSIHSYNLVPCCSYCNEKKSKLFLDKEGFRKIFNPYFEDVGDQPIINCSLECLETSIKSHLELREDVNIKVWLNHLSTLDLIRRYEAELPRVLSSIMFDIIVNYEENGVDSDGAKRVMKRKLVETEQIQGHNSLDAIVYRAFLEIDRLFDINYLRKVYFKMVRSAIPPSSSVS